MGAPSDCCTREKKAAGPPHRDGTSISLLRVQQQAGDETVALDHLSQVGPITEDAFDTRIYCGAR